MHEGRLIEKRCKKEKMRAFKLLLKEVKQENKWDYEPKDEIKLGKVAITFTGMVDDNPVEFKKGDEIYYQHGTKATLDGEDYILVSLTSIVCLK